LIKTIYYVGYCDEWEAEGFFDENGNILAAWHGNEGNWRGEYFDGIFESLGIDVDYSKSNDKEFVDKLKKDTSGE
jgi:hypothetical protein